MSFTTITTGEIASGEPNKHSTWQKVKDNFDDHESRMEVVEATLIGSPPIVLRVNGYYCICSAILKTTTNLTMTITGARLLIDTAGSGGATQIDIKRKRGGGSYTTIFTTKPSVTSASGNDALSTNGVLDATMVQLQAGDILALDIVTAQTNGYGFEVRIDYHIG